MFRRRKGGVKAHTVLDLRVGIFVFLRVSHAKTHDLWALDPIVPQFGAFYVLDQGDLDFARLYRLHLAGSFFVTRAKRGMNLGIRKRLAVPQGAAGITSDRLIRLRGPKSRRLFPDTLRRVRYVDPDTHKRLAFLTNNLTLDAKSIALLYRKRWRVELFFKWVKQHLHVKAFLGTTPNAVKTQLWVAVIVYVLGVKLKHRYPLPQDLNEVLQVLSVTILEKTPIFELFSELRRQNVEDENHNQLQLFEF